MISFNSLTKAYGKHQVLRGFSLRAEEGCVTLLVGSNGAGKTTALKIASGLLDADAGTVRIGDECIRRDRHRAQKLLSSLPQNVNFHPRLTVEQTLRFYAKVRRVPRHRVSEEIERWGLPEHAGKPVGALSGGLRQRLGLAVLMLPDVPALLLDEPGISVDPDWRTRMQQILSAEAARGRAILVATHLLGEWQDRAQRCFLCEAGRVAREIDPAKLRTELPETFRIAAV